MNILSNLIGKFFFLGNSKYMPGTIGSFAGILLWVFFPEDLYARIIIIVITWIVGHYAINNILKGCDEQDPPSIVIDEVVGMWISCIFINNDLIMILVAFSLFRLFDIFKPSFIYHVQKIDGAWGIMLDDVLSGLLTSVIILFFSI